MRRRIGYQYDLGYRLPASWCEGIEVIPGGHGGQPAEDIAQVSERIDLSALAGDDNRLNDGRSLSGVGVANEEPVLFPDGGGSDGKSPAEDLLFVSHTTV
jgi:hypothetical protein